MSHSQDGQTTYVVVKLPNQAWTTERAANYKDRRAGEECCWWWCGVGPDFCRGHGNESPRVDVGSNIPKPKALTNPDICRGIMSLRVDDGWVHNGIRVGRSRTLLEPPF